MKILILGSKGMLAQDMVKVFEEEELFLWDREDLDITNKEDVGIKILETRPDVVINTAAFTDVDGAEANKKIAFKVNAEAVGYLVETAKKADAILVHFSTDYVFGQEKKEGYKETDIPKSPKSIYGESKLEGEKEILKEKNLKYYLIRLSWLFGPSFGHDYKNFVNTILRIAKEKEEIKVVDDQFGKPTYTLDLARALKNIIEKNKDFGIYHLPNETSTNWFEFAKKIVQVAGLETKIIPCKTEEFPTPAKRPKYSTLLNTKIKLQRSWQVALEEYINN